MNIIAQAIDLQSRHLAKYNRYPEFVQANLADARAQLFPSLPKLSLSAPGDRLCGMKFVAGPPGVVRVWHEEKVGGTTYEYETT